MRAVIAVSGITVIISALICHWRGGCIRCTPNERRWQPQEYCRPNDIAPSLVGELNIFYLFGVVRQTAPFHRPAASDSLFSVGVIPGHCGCCGVVTCVDGGQRAILQSRCRLRHGRMRSYKTNPITAQQEYETRPAMPIDCMRRIFSWRQHFFAFFHRVADLFVQPVRRRFVLHVAKKASLFSAMTMYYIMYTLINDII